MTLTVVVVAAFVVSYGALLVIALRRPLLARLALREAVRRRGQSAVVVLGLMVGTIAIFAMQVLGDSFYESQTQGAFLAWGRVDLVATEGGGLFDPALATALAADPHVGSSLAGVQAGVELPSSVVDLDRGNAKPLVMLVGFDPATQRPFGSYQLTDGRTTVGQDLGPDEVLISASLAYALDAHPGDRLRVSIGPQQAVELRVAGVAQAQGPGAYTLRPALFSPLANLRPLIGGQGINVIRLTAPGEGRAELDRATELAPHVRAALQAIPGGRGLNVQESKRKDFDAQVKQVDRTRGLYTALSLFIALAGAALVVNLGLALAEERRPRHAVLRALGLSRAGMVALSLVEGALYSLAAGVMALVPGALFGLALVALLYVRVNSVAVDNRTAPVQYAVSFSAIALSVAIGALIVLATLLATSVRSSRMQISSAIKNLPEPTPRRKRSVWRTALLVGLGLGSLAALVIGTLPVRLAGGVGLVILAAALVGGRISDRLRATLTGAATTVWVVANLATVEDVVTPESGLANVMGMVAAAFGLSVVVAANLRVLEVPLGWLQGRARATLRPSLAYLTRRPLRAGLGTGAFALVLLLMTVTAIIIPTFNAQFRTALTEYDIRVNSPTNAELSLPDSVRPQIAREVAMPTRPYRGEVTTSNGVTEQDRYLPLYSLSRAQLLSAPFQLAGRDSRYKSDAEVWQALADDPHLVLSPTYTVSGGTVTLAGPAGPVTFRLAGVLRNVGLWGLAGSEAAMARFTTLPVGMTVLAKTAPGADPVATARQIQRAVFSQGAEATTVKEMLDSASSAGQAFTDMVRLVMGIGLLVGVLSLGILALRAVIERRRSIGMLRALGYRPRQVLAGMVTEAVITATCGALVGIGVGVPISAVLAHGYLPGAPLEVDYLSLALIIGVLYLAVLAVTIVPALRAAGLPAVEALRLED
ncbi:MAG: FtsX-like permease family protein [Chloroflexi bacterium]|nr:MAG: FtsX-like permease family protein [Chloroflexota bacterium]